VIWKGLFHHVGNIRQRRRLVVRLVRELHEK
jgi:hypothetical protein